MWKFTKTKDEENKAYSREMIIITDIAGLLEKYVHEGIIDGVIIGNRLTVNTNDNPGENYILLGSCNEIIHKKD